MSWSSQLRKKFWSSQLGKYPVHVYDLILRFSRKWHIYVFVLLRCFFLIFCFFVLQITLHCKLWYFPSKGQKWVLLREGRERERERVSGILGSSSVRPGCCGEEGGRRPRLNGAAAWRLKDTRRDLRINFYDRSRARKPAGREQRAESFVRA